MVHAPEVTDYIKNAATKLEAISDHVDDVNKLKGQTAVETAYDAESKFDAEKDKASFRRYEEACDRVKNFYAVSSKMPTVSLSGWQQHPCHSRRRVSALLTMSRSNTRSRRSRTTSVSASRWRKLSVRA